MKIGLECADGGHLDEMLSLIDALDHFDKFFVTFRTDATRDLCRIANTHFVPNFRGIIDTSRLPVVLRQVYTAIYLIRTVPRCLSILRREKPDIIISTGGPVTLPMFFLGKMLGVQRIYVESITRVQELSGTGKLAYPMADVFLVQWKSLTAKYRNAQYWGRVL